MKKNLKASLGLRLMTVLEKEDKTRPNGNLMPEKLSLFQKQHFKTQIHFKVFWTWSPSASSQHLVLYSSTVKPLF